MEFKDLRCFLAIAREKTISGAAQSLHLTQPTLSRRMLELEAELGKTLFIRGNRKIVLTEEGIFLRKRAQEVLALMAKTEAEFNSSGEHILGEVSVGGGEIEAVRVFARAIKRLHAAHPQITYTLSSANAETTMERLENGLVDFGIFIEPVDLSKYDFFRLKERYAFGILMRKESILSRFAAIRPEQLLGLPVICPSRAVVKSEFAAWMGEAFARLHCILSYDLPYNASIMVEEHIGYAVCLEKAFTMAPETFCFRPLDPPLEVGVAVAWKKDQRFSKAAAAFLELLRQEAL